MIKQRYGRYSNDKYYTYEDLEKYVRDAFGDTACAYAIQIAELDDFDEFVNAMKSVGVRRLDDKDRLYHLDNHVPPFANAILCLRYPFLFNFCDNQNYEQYLKDIENSKIDNSKAELEAKAMFIDVHFGYTSYQSIPTGWAARFGLEMLEDIRTILEQDSFIKTDPNRCEAIEKYYIDQIKEKYGTLRWYDAGIMEDHTREALFDLVNIYEIFSGSTCIECGAIEDVFITSSGWISTLCYRHLSSSWKEEDAIDVFAKEHGYTKGWVGYELSQAISRYLSTKGCSVPDVELSELTVTSGFGNEKTTRIPYDDLKRNYPNLRIFELEKTYNKVKSTQIPTIREIEELIEKNNNA